MRSRFFTNLIPRNEQTESTVTFRQALASTTWVQWALFFSCWLAWTCDAMDFFSVSLTVPYLETEFHKSAQTITTSITLTLVFCASGALVFGVLSDRFGRKWPLVANLVLCAVLELAAGFATTFAQFLALRALFGVAMGGVWGLAASGLESLPVEVRGLASGVLQQGYAVGYLLAAVVNLQLVPRVKQGWRALFWTAAGLSLLAAGVRALLPESDVFLRAKAAERAQGVSTAGKTRLFMHELKVMLVEQWPLCIYAILLMTGFDFLSHGSQDLYPTYLETSKGLSAHAATVATIIGTCGAVAGGALAGQLSQRLGRRLTIVLFVLLVGAFIPLWILPSSFGGLAAGAFCVQFGVQGAWGVVPIFLAEMSPPAFRATFPGAAYQLGNMVSSASAQIEASAGVRLRTTIVLDGVRKEVPDYATVQAILISVVAAFVVFMAMIGPENRGAHFERAKTAWEGPAAPGDEELTVPPQLPRSGSSLSTFHTV